MPLPLFLPCAAGVEALLAEEVARLVPAAPVRAVRGGVALAGDPHEVMALNLESRLAQRVLIEVGEGPYRDEGDLYALARAVAWSDWITPRQTLRVDTTAQKSPLRSLNFAALRVKDAVADRFRNRGGVRPDVDTQRPAVRVFAHLDADSVTLYIDTSGEPLFKRGWRTDKGDAPLKETLAAAMLAASGWWNPETGEVSQQPLYDPCCGSGTIPIEAAQIAAGMPAGGQRRFGFEKLLPFQAHVWQGLKQEAQERTAAVAQAVPVFGSDVSHRMVDFAQRNAERAGVSALVQLRGGDALQRMPPAEAGVIMLNPPYGERIEVGGVARAGGGGGARDRGAPAAPATPGGREAAQTEDGGEFFAQLSAHWKKNYAGWTGWVLTPDLKLPSKMRLKESRRVPMWNGPIECRLFRFDLKAGRFN